MLGIFKKRVKTFHAIQFTLNQLDEMVEWLNNGSYIIATPKDGLVLYIPTWDTELVAFQGDWIIRDENGDIYVYRDDEFVRTFEEVNS